MPTNSIRLPYRILKGRLAPLIPLYMFHNGSSVLEYAYVDSGTWFSIFRDTVANDLGVDIYAGRQTTVTGVGGTPVTVYLHLLGIRIADWHWTAEVGFTTQLGLSFNLLGRHTVFDHIEFCFNDRTHELTLAPLSSQ